jgi:hypothetical protein
MKIDIVKTLQYLRPNEQWTLIGLEYSGLTWFSDTAKPTEEELNEAWTTVVEKLVLWEPVRTRRNGLLTASDWTQLNDVTLPNREEWVEYRQKLRDVTHDFSSPDDVIWPVPPA